MREVASFFAVDDVKTEELPLRYNVAPSQPVYTVAERRAQDGERPQRLLGAYRWGLVPWWAKDPSVGAKMINAMAETVATKAAYKQALVRRRCLIPADGFYEWQVLEGDGRRRKVPYLIRHRDGSPLAFAGLWEVWRGDPDEPLRNCVIITTNGPPPLGQGRTDVRSGRQEEVGMRGRVLVVGAGSAGCVVAARLSEDPGTSVILLEAGPDYADVVSAPDDIRSAYVMGGTAHDWGYMSQPLGRTGNIGVVQVLRGKVVGGSSAVNGAAILRARSTDFDAWVAAGNDRWSWDQVLPAFCQLEDDPAPGGWHGQGGPLPIRRFRWAEMRPIHRAFLEACDTLGYVVMDDHNAPGAIGAGPIPLNQVDGIRQSSAVTHLAQARHRSNLTVRSGVTVDRLDIVDRSARSVRLTNGERLDADSVVLSAGAYGSPAILMRSGIGPSDALEAAGIKPLVHLPAVGENLRDHPMFVLTFAGNTDTLGELAPPVQTVLTLASDGSPIPAHIDLQVGVMTSCAPEDGFPAPLGTVVVTVGLMKPRSTGRMCLASAAPDDPPRIWLNFFDDPNDTDRMLHGIDVARTLFATRSLKAYVLGEQFPGTGIHDDALRALIRTSTPSFAHGTGTCQMGWHPDTSVVDQTGRVHGVDNLWTIDASIMPALPSVPTNLATMMLAERCAAWLRAA
jgi:choline dehydrogenase